jgi:hypothetical protein
MRLTPTSAARAELLRVLMLATSSVPSGIGEFWSYPQIGASNIATFSPENED